MSYHAFPMSPKTITDWREDPHAEPEVDRKAIENYIARTVKNPTDVDIETFIMIEECNTWFEEYKNILRRIK